MDHVSLYRRWRPRRFGQIVGQEPVVRTLRRAIETGKVAHAYLFAGPRGTGKTSTAKVLAMGLNCERGPTPEPCGECASCRAVVNNSSVDVLEMDAASNRGIDEIRELRDRVNLAPAQGRKKVYIIDEVHMLTTEAFNALLKMLEEPPEHVVFVLATTEKHKVLPTIVSRCQSFDFRRPGVDTLVEKLEEIAAAEGIEAEPEALAAIARAGNGSFRDAEGLLDQLASFAEGPVTAAQVRELLGSVGPEVLLETVDALNERRAGDALRVVDRISREGRDPGQFLQDLLAHCKRLMLLPHAPEVALAEVGGEERATLEEQARRVPASEVVRIIETLGETAGRIRRGGGPRLELELAFLKLARDYVEPSVEGLLLRLERLEKAVESGAAPAAPRERPPEERAEAAPESGSPGSGAAEGGLERFVSGWQAVLQDLRDRRQVPTAAVFQEGRPVRYEAGTLEVAFPKEQAFYVRLGESGRHAEALGSVLEDRFGEKVRVRCSVAEDGRRSGPRPPAEEGPERVRVEPRREPPQTPPPGPEPSRAEPEGRREGDDIIQSPQEAVEMLRDALGSERNGGR
ncbi:DNA polymerase III subunit gamma/tau [Rubrobacter taiwanensis]|jgi:DNA polymerase-3 subunit gamma/tau|uniref:DNA polymerase III subunit gamma/tau n=1 Tax=Rubrobacter taiwanensis TaxID=185139 RepID=A0A4R1BI07_9ACTN|nr:DNA polymerase III subunit gamma/tau [Rubrobacter taiwanensis]TCJ16889.1 DNA polymerase III subunit gamma/tau [Rubrobacter taiwanensis]